VRKVIVVAIAMLLVAAAAWGQGTDPLLGPHNVGGVGCQSCHAPHNALAGPGAYLWGREIPTRVYTTYTTSNNEGGSLSSLPSSGVGMVGTSGVAIGSTTNPGGLATVNTTNQAHTILCLSCHDTTFSSMGCATSITGCTNTIYTGTAGSGGVGILAGTNYAVGNNGDLSRDHPVDVIYPQNDPTYWANFTFTGTPNGQYTVTFGDQTYPYGHPGRLFSIDGSTAYIECGTCHNPHAQMNAVVTIAGALTAVPTSHFIRGQYRASDEKLAGTLPTSYTSANYDIDNANFCMSCHSYPSAQFSGLVH